MRSFCFHYLRRSLRWIRPLRECDNCPSSRSKILSRRCATNFFCSACGEFWPAPFRRSESCHSQAQRGSGAPKDGRHPTNQGVSSITGFDLRGSRDFTGLTEPSRRILKSGICALRRFSSLRNSDPGERFSLPIFSHRASTA